MMADSIKNSPAPCSKDARTQAMCKIIKNLAPQQKRVYNILARGGRYTAGEITVALGGRACDPRGTIRDLRKKVSQFSMNGTPMPAATAVVLKNTFWKRR